MVRVIHGVLLLLACGWLVGCGDGRPQRVRVSGKVLIDGAPLTAGFIQVIPENDRAASSKIEPDGGFRLTTFDPQDGCVPGQHKVVVIASERLNALSQKWNAPKKYADPQASGLTVDIKEPTDSLTINLSWEGGKPFIEKFEAE